MSNDDLIFGVDGDKITCKRKDFINLAESLCGFGDNEAQAFADLLRQEAFRDNDITEDKEEEYGG